MFGALRSRLRTAALSPPLSIWRAPDLCLRAMTTFPSPQSPAKLSPTRLLELQEVEEILNDVKADDVRVIPVRGMCQWADFMVIATGRSAWHVRNIAQALIYKVKEKQRGADQMLLPSVDGYDGGKWVVVDSGNVVVHALDEKARAYYNLENLWTAEKASKEQCQDIELIS